MLYFTHLPRSPQWVNLYQIWCTGSPRGRNQLCRIFCRLVQGYWLCRGLKFAYPHRNWRSPLTLPELPFRLWYIASHLHVGVNVPPSEHCHYHFHNICYILCTCTNLCDTEHSEIRNVSHIDYMNTSFLQCFFFCDWSVKVSFDVHCLSHTVHTIISMTYGTQKQIYMPITWPNNKKV